MKVGPEAKLGFHLFEHGFNLVELEIRLHDRLGAHVLGVGPQGVDSGLVSLGQVYGLVLEGDPGRRHPVGVSHVRPGHVHLVMAGHHVLGVQSPDPPHDVRVAQFFQGVGAPVVELPQALLVALPSRGDDVLVLRTWNPAVFSS